MVLSIKDEETDRLARELSRVTGESLTEAVSTAVRQRLARVQATGGQDLAGELTVIALRCAALPVLDDRPDDQVLGYDASGAPV